MSKSLYFPLLIFPTASASIIVISGTRLQCPPVYADFLSIAVAISLMKDSKRTSNSLIKFLFVITIAAWLARLSIIFIEVENEAISPVLGFLAFNN